MSTKLKTASMIVDWYVSAGFKPWLHLKQTLYNRPNFTSVYLMFVIFILTKDIVNKFCMYRNDPKFSDRQAWANRADLEQSDQGLHCLQFPLRFLMHYAKVKPSCLRVVTANFQVSEIFRKFTIILDSLKQHLHILGEFLVLFFFFFFFSKEPRHEKTCLQGLRPG